MPPSASTTLCRSSRCRRSPLSHTECRSSILAWRQSQRKEGTYMELKPLGNSGVMVPEIGLGVWRYSGGVEPLRLGIELGAFLIDTAEIYGTEDAVSQAIKGFR